MKSQQTLKQVQENIKLGHISCMQIVERYLDNISAQKDLNAFLETFDEEAKTRAQEIDEKIAMGQAGKLAGMVIGLKDVLCYKDHQLQCASKILGDFESQFSATAVQRLIDEDAIIIGRLNCDEFAMGSSNENSAFGHVKNADAPDRVPGGSSGGSAVAVQADMCRVALGTDTGGSVRQPAAFCGVIGMKPTYSRISRYGLAAYASSFDTIGIFSKHIEDNALVLQVIAGADDFDSTVSTNPVEAYSEFSDIDNKAYKIAYIQETLDSEGISTEIKDSTVNSLNRLKEAGHQVDALEFPLLEYILPTYYILTTAEASSNLSRYDGVKYGYRSPNTKDLESMYKKSRGEGFGEEVKRRIMLGTFVLSASYYDAYYTKAQKVRRLIRDQTKEILKEYDFIMMPTTPTTAFKIGEFNQDPLQMYLADLLTVQASVSGTPAISIPNGKDSQGLPIGLQIIADDFKEKELFAFSDYLISLN
ncbi:MAG: Asp-tRNA(Asn)/Glu-tRNA(Gln) amidotransferase subunit GatA [Bacteroidota bacterium]